MTEQQVVGTVHERKATMADLSEVIVVWPGGLGTTEEALVALRWTQVRVRVKPPVGILEMAGYLDSPARTTTRVQPAGDREMDRLNGCGPRPEICTRHRWTEAQPRRPGPPWTKGKTRDSTSGIDQGGRG